MRISRRHALAGLAALPLAGCQMAPGTGHETFNIVSAEEEQEMGRKSHPQILAQFGGASDDPRLQAYVAGIGQRLVRHTETPGGDFRFTVLNSDIANAMAVPGGYVYVTRALLALTGNEAELAGVIGHEIGHVTARHSSQRYSRAMATNLGLAVLGAVVGVPGVADVAQMGASAWLQSYSQDNEFEADSLGVRYMSRSGYNAEAMVTMLTKLRAHSRLEAVVAGQNPDAVDEHHFMATHPRTLDRVNAAIQQTLGAPPQGAVGTDSFLDAVDGMIYGDDPAQGVVRDRLFLHPQLGFRFEVPAGFRLVNGDKAVLAKHPGGAVIIFDSAPARGHADMAAYLGRVWAAKSTLDGLERIDINGLAAATATTRGRTRQGAVDLRLVAIRFDADTLYRFTFATPPRLTAQLGVDLRRTTYSFRPIAADERALAQPWRVSVVTVRSGDTAESLGARMAMRAYPVEHFRLLNGLGPEDQPLAGQRVKLVV
ncbi:MAG: M48 family metalloprotease [Magnetospirillum sp.]|nr:M48 family metalloprotease [Magnetospirillum sp.]